MRKIVLYYSLDGNTRFVAGAIAAAAEAELLELRPKDEKVPRGLMKFFWGGRQVMTKQQPELVPLGKNIETYDIIFIGTPVWAWSYAPALATFFSHVTLRNKKIALFCCHGGGKGKVFEKMKEKLPGNEIIGQIDFIEPLRTGKERSAQRAGEWARQLL